MERRRFIHLAGVASAGALFPNAGTGPSLRPLDGPSSAEGRILRAKDVAARLRSLVSVTEPSVDRIVIGDPETEVANIGTAWLPYWETCRQAVRDGVNTLVVHEPTFYTHWDLDEKSADLFAASAAGKEAYLKAVREKKDWILTNKLVVIRCHDVLDKVGKFGIPHAFGRWLGFAEGDIVRSKPYYNVYRIEPKPAVEVARSIARKLADLRQPGVAFYGDGSRLVDSVGVGTGCFSDPIEFMDLAPGLFIAIDDVVRTWTQTVFARDTGHPLVVINHGTSEEAGVRLLSEHLGKTYPERKVFHYAQGCGYEWVTGRGGA
ncbi:MAG: Nif3-like dinuclear metal center hexameric protein [Candidatus Aminicenantes bacterium]|nr:Nif3-like dinuclear metal center hexameric protein [Candidatus Aminicenantes bacterium]